MNENQKSKQPTSGVVTFLDVLGWKGVYDRKPDAISSLTRLIEGVRTRATKFQRGRTIESVDVKSISDTVAVFTKCYDRDIADVIEIHGELCAWLIPESINSEIPMRGATSFGDFDILENIFVGKAIDEAASWHEQADWIGVHLTPSAEYVFKPKSANSVWSRFQPPNKTRLNWNPHCVNWTINWIDRAHMVEEIKGKFRRLGPIVPEIAGKFVNTLGFIEAMNPNNQVNQ